MFEQTQHTIDKLARPPGTVVPRAAVGAATLTPKEIMGILRRHIFLIILCTMGGLFISGCTWALMLKFYPKYTALTYIAVLSPTKVDPTLLTVPIPNKDIMYQSRLSKAILITGQNSFYRLLRADEVRSTQWFQNFGGDIVKAMDNLKKNLSAVAQRDSDYVAVSMTCGSAKESALIVNKMVDLFVTEQGTSVRSDLLTQLGELRTQQKNVEDELKTVDASMEELRTVSAKEGVMMLGQATEQQYNTITLRLNDLSVEKNKILADIGEIEANIGTLAELAKGPVTVQVEHQVEIDPIMINLGERLSLLEGDLARKLAKFGENHKEVRQERDLIKQTREERNTRQAQIAEQTRQSNWKDAQDRLVFLKSRLEQVENNRAEAEAKQKDFDAQQAKYVALTKLRDERQKRLDEIKLQIEKINMMRTDPEAPKVRSVGLAPEPLRVSSPDLRIYIPGGFMLGLFAGIGLAFLIELLSELVRTPSDVNKHLRIPLLGMVPNMDEDDLPDGVDPCHIVRQAPYSIISESYRQLKTNLRLCGTPESTKIILVTSAAPEEGKTSVAINLAATLAVEDKRVLLIDTNFRRPTSLRIFPTAITAENSHIGLSALLTGQCVIKNALRSSGIHNLDIIDSGLMPANSAELLGNVRMRQLLAELQKSYDNIILDSAPVLLVSDAKILAAMVDGIMVVANAAATKRGMAIRMLRELREINGRIIGCVLFNVKALKGGYFHETFRSYREYQKVQMIQPI